eukprot:NODE_10575_length_331_cov_11.067376_g9663_i0.p1 GENE.NODE_10575_length_331_cov_11.067376_g9663_i0~~NODE_10575_length_331_cov_11.067376_g9663_i0.p1  ORF type:complete len:61 (-),score=15.98 NODE_10575_length_331_cov_11.067376_g9663_i0:148-303(-)
MGESSFIGLNTYTGENDNFQWEDYLNQPSMEEVQPHVHTTMEIQTLGEAVS